MYKLTNPVEIKRLMAKHGKTFKKALGQNFLINEEVLDGIVSSSGITQTDNVLEIGPGIGVLTCKLAMTGANVATVEIDTQLLPILDETLADYPNVQVINADFMKLSMDELLENRFGGGKVKVAANLPYYITTPIIMRLLEYKTSVISITVMVQKEVAERLVAKHGSKDFGAISLAVQYRANAEITQIVPAENFMPAPKVDSAVVKLDILDKPPVSVISEKMLFRVIKGGFALRRKTLSNSLAAGADIPKEKTLEALESLGLPSTVRGEALSLQNYADLSDYFSKNL